MADPTGIFPVSLEQNKPEGERDKRRRLTTLMESLRSRTSQHKTWVDCVKAVRTAISDKRHQPDALDKGHLQRCLDSLQRAIKVISQQSLIERLETIARQLSLSSSIQPGPEQHLIISSDMFHVQIIFDKGGGVKDVKVAHGGEANSCQELVEVLSRRDFAEFASHLEGLLKIYQIVGDKKVKSKAFLSLQSLESDLNLLAQLQSSINGVGNYIHKSPLGILLPRKGGLPMKLIYFVSPYDLLDKKSKSAHAMTVEAITEHGLGQSVTVCLEAATPNKLQTMPLMTVVNRDGKGIPSFQGLTHVNSFTFPACFVLELPEPIPLALSMIQKIQSHTNIDIEKGAEPKPLLSLIMEKYSNGKTLNETELFVSLPDQQHVYFMSNVNGSSLDQPGVMVSRIPFTHPMNVAHILSHLRQQLVFNTVVSSCIRPNSKQDMANAVVIELTTISLQQICITMEHPVYDSMLNVELDLGDITSLKCRLSSGHTDQVLCTDDFASRVFQRCLSIPITLRSIIKKGREQLQKLLEERLAAMKMALWQRNNRPQPTQTPSIHSRGRQPVFVNPALSQVPQQMAPMQQMQHQVSHHHMPHPMTHQMSHHHHHQLQQQQQHQLQVNQLPPPAQMTDMRGQMQDMRGQMQDMRSTIADLLSPPLDKIGNNPLLAGLLDQEHDGSSQEVNDSPMLSKLLEDQTTGAASTAAAAAAAAAAGSIPLANATKPSALHKRVRKRRSTSDQLGRSPKHRLSDGEGNDKITTIDLDSSCSPFDSSLQSSSGLPPAPGLQSIIDLTEDSFGESNLKKLADSMDSLIPKDQKQATENELSALLSDADPGRSLLSKNSSPGSKNENASTSLEDLLAGSGEGNEALDPASSLSSSSSSIASDKNSGRNAAFLGFKSSSPRQDSKSPISSSFHKEVFSPDRERSDPLHSAMFDRTAFDLPETKYSVKTPPIKTESSSSDRREITGLFEKFEKLKNENVEPMCTSIVKIEEGKGLKLKLPALRHSDSRSAPAVSMESLSSKSLGKQSNVGTFDFKSDEDEDEPLPSLSGSERLAVYAASPTRLQITNKSKNSYDTSSRRKSEKYKRKESKYGSSGESVKRKRGKDESKKERKKRKLGESNQYSSVAVNKTVYHAATVESDQKSVTKLKIRVSKEPSFKIEEDTSKKSSKHSSTPVVDKLIVSKHDLKDPDIISSHKSQSSSQKSLHRSSSLSQRSASPNQSQGNSVSKSDPKLATKTTIRLKPLNIPNSGSSVTVQTDKKSPSTLSTAKNLTSTKTSVSNSSRPQAPIVSKVSLSPSPVRTPTSSPSKLASQSSGKSSSSKSLTSSKSSSSLPKPPTSLSLSKNPVSNLSKSPSASNSPKSVTSTKSSTPTSSAKTPTTPVTAKTPSSSSKSHSSSPARPSSQNPKLSSSQTIKSSSSSSGSPKTSTSSSKSSSSNRSVSSSSNKSSSSSKTQTSSSSRPQSSSTKSQSSGLTKSSSSSSSKDKNASKTSSTPKSSNASSSSSSKNSSTSGPSLPAALSIASFLPDAPTASSVASLPPIPKLSSSSSSSGTSHSSNTSQGSGASSSKDLSTNTSGAAPNSGGSSNTSASHSSKASASSSANVTKSSSGSASGNTSSKSNSTVNSKPVESSSASEGAGGNGSGSGSSGDAGANKGKLPAARSRKGSLSAVIDKLTKSSTTAVHVSTMTPGEVLAKQAREKAEQENRALAEQRASRSDPKAQDHVLNSSKTEREKSDSGDTNRNRMDSQIKRNMSVGSSNKDSPKVLSSVNNKVSRNEMIKLGQNSSPLNKVVTSENNSVSSSPRTNSLGSSRSVGRASPVNKEALKNRDSPVGRASPGGKSSPGIKDSPGRPGASTNSVLDGKDKVNAFSKDDNKNRRQSVESGRSGSPVTGNKPVGNVSNNKKSELSDKGSIKGGSVSPLTIQNVQNVGVEKRSPSQKHCTSPLVFNNTKFNGESSREKTPNKEEREAFKVPTPKASTPETRDMDELECVPRKKQRVNKNVSSPHSDASSPENGLVIDCPGTPKVNSNGPSPMPVLESPVKDTPAPPPPTDGKPTPVKSSTVSSSPKSKVHQSPRPSQSPAGVKVTSNSETPGSGDTRHSPCEIDDELMDEALMGLNS
ncbi:mediator of RNA polymerase II transcription subunit 1-like [Haliotis rufescens]|uniref:mediator of RNA polymerase II transcription subunit 1-like n=1 Tax=Haliotis rufescens TaxID=6454 RepID=UPI00201EA1DF|nr:mediator of RNA polymerase II transcription subunit 1-like [Haliotis rufescens]